MTVCAIKSQQITSKYPYLADLVFGGFRIGVFGDWYLCYMSVTSLALKICILPGMEGNMLGIVYWFLCSLCKGEQMNIPKQTFAWLDKLIFPSQKCIGLILAWYMPWSYCAYHQNRHCDHRDHLYTHPNYVNIQVSSMVTMRNLPKTKLAKFRFIAMICSDLVAQTVIRGHAILYLSCFCYFKFKG